MISSLYQEILCNMKKALDGREVVLVQDRDSSHISRSTLTWMERNGLDFINLPSKSPDLSVMETYVSVLRRKFFQERSYSLQEGRVRFYQAWNSLKMEKIHESIKEYPSRLQECIHHKGQGTRY
jgi:hypothetical protein